MASTNLVRWGTISALLGGAAVVGADGVDRDGLVRPISALLGGAAVVALSLESIARPDPERFRSAFFHVPWLLSAGGIVGLHAR